MENVITHKKSSSIVESTVSRKKVREILLFL